MGTSRSPLSPVLMLWAVAVRAHLQTFDVTQDDKVAKKNLRNLTHARNCTLAQ
jgi:hypothetical protein